MANVCMYGMEVTGMDENVAKFVEYMKGDKEKRLCGVYTDEVYYMYYNNKHIVNGGCKHSIYISMLEMDGSYYDRLTEEEKTEFTSIEELSKELELTIEIVGKSDIGADREDINVEHGRITHYE